MKKVRFPQSFYLKKIHDLCKSNKIDHVIYRNEITNKFEFISIVCNEDEYYGVLRYNFFMKRCKFVYVNVSRSPMQFILAKEG